MANKSVIKVDIDDKQFKEFYALYQEYEERLAHAPEEWKKIDDVAGETHAKFAAAAGLMSDAMLNATRYARELSESMRDAIDAQTEFGDQAERSSKALSDMSKHAKDVGKSVFGIGKFLMGMTGLNIGVSALSAFGMDKLATHAVINQREANGLGMTTGQYRAFDTDLGRYLNPGILNSVADAQNSYTKRIWLARATGMDPSQLTGMDPGAIAAQLALKGHDWWASTPASMHTEEQLRATGFTQSGLSLEDLRRLGATPRSQLEVGQAQYRMDSQALNIGTSPTNAMYDFMRQVTLAGQKLETSLTDKLSGVAPALGRLVDGLEKDAELLLNNIFTEKNVNAIANGIDTFTKYLGSQEFRDTAQQFLDAIKVLGKAAIKVAGWLVPGEDKDNPGGGLQDYSFADMTLNPERYHVEEVAPGVKVKVLNKPTTGAGSVGTTTASGVPMDQAMQAFAGLESTYKLPSGLLSATAQNESSFNPNALSSKGAQGLMQLMPEVSRSLGVKNPYDWKESATGGAKLFSELQDRYHGDIKKELAAWNWNPKSVDAAIKANGADWDKHLPKETQDFITRVMATLQRQNLAQQKVKIEVTNKSGNNVAVSVNAASL